MSTLEKQRELIKLIDNDPENRQEHKRRLNSMIQAEIDIRREEERLDQLKTGLAIESNI